MTPSEHLVTHSELAKSAISSCVKLSKQSV
nr:MAG TPA: hypothetical protein [Caudoviricetes sp.]